jgi:hypothetical protein
MVTILLKRERKAMKKIDPVIKTFLIAVAMLFLYGNVEASSRRGADIVVQKKDGTQLQGELIAVKQDSILLLDSETGVDISARIDDTEIIHILKGPKTGLGAFSGLLVGGIVGAAAMRKDKGCDQCPGSGQRPLIGGALVGGLGALIGALIGSTTGGNEIYIIQGLPQEELDAVLEKLRSKARIRNFR